MPDEALDRVRPSPLKALAHQSESLTDFGLHLRDWLHGLRLVSSRPLAAVVITEERPHLSHKFAQGEVADAWLAASTVQKTLSCVGSK